HLVDVGVADARVLDVDQAVELADRAALDGGALQRGLGRGRGVSGDSGHRWVLLGIGPRPVSLCTGHGTLPAAVGRVLPGMRSAYDRCSYHRQDHVPAVAGGDTGRHGRTTR